MAHRFMRPMDVGDMMDSAFRAYRARILTFLTIAVVAYMPYAVAMSVWQSLLEPALTSFVELRVRVATPPDLSGVVDSTGHPPTKAVAQANGAGATGVQVSLADVPGAVWTAGACVARVLMPGPMAAVEPSLVQVGVIAQARPDTEQLFASLRLLGLLAIGAVINLLFVVVVDPFARAALVYNISASYLGRELSAAQAYRLALPRMPALIAASVLAWMAIIAGYCMMVVPGVLVQVWMMVLTPAILLERRGPIDAIRRSYRLVSGNITRSFLLAAAVFLLSMVGALMINVMVELLPISSEPIKLFAINVGNAALLPATVGPAIFLYYDLRIRKEAMDLTMLGEAMA